jgi:hypothetical protein
MVEPNAGAIGPAVDAFYHRSSPVFDSANATRLSRTAMSQARGEEGVVFSTQKRELEGVRMKKRGHLQELRPEGAQKRRFFEHNADSARDG